MTDATKLRAELQTLQDRLDTHSQGLVTLGFNEVDWHKWPEFNALSVRIRTILAELAEIDAAGTAGKEG